MWPKHTRLLNGGGTGCDILTLLRGHEHSIIIRKHYYLKMFFPSATSSEMWNKNQLTNKITMQEKSAVNGKMKQSQLGCSKAPSLASVGAVINVEGVLIGVSDVTHWTLTPTVR